METEAPMRLEGTHVVVARFGALAHTLAIRVVREP